MTETTGDIATTVRTGAPNPTEVQDLLTRAFANQMNQRAHRDHIRREAEQMRRALSILDAEVVALDESLDEGQAFLREVYDFYRSTRS